MAIGRPISLTPNIATKNISSLATADQTEFTVTGGYRVNEIAVYRNGVRLAEGRDFTASDGDTVNLLSACTVSDVIEFAVFDSFNVSDAIVSAASSQNLNGDFNVTGILYAGDFKTSGLTLGISTVSSSLHVGSALTANAAGDVETIGVITASSFKGDGSSLTFSSAVNIDATTDSTSTSTGALIVDGGVGIAKNVYIGAGLSVAGTLTYEDVTNVDSVGLITAKSGVNVTGGQLTVGSGITMGIAGVATFSGTSDVHLLDNVKLLVGDGSDLQVYHDGSTSYVSDEGTGILRVRGSEVRLCNPSNSTYFTGTSGASAKVYYNDSVKLETTNDGTVTTGIATATGGLAINADNKNLTIGAGDDLTLFHDSSRSAINNATGELRILSGSDITIGKRSAADSSYSEQLATFKVDGAVELYHNNSKKFETTTAGTKTTGIATADGFDIGDNEYFVAGNSNDFLIWHDGSNSFIDSVNNTADIYIRSRDKFTVSDQSTGEVRLQTHDDGAVDLYYDGTKTFETTNEGIEVTGFTSTTAGMGVTGGLFEGSFIKAGKLSDNLQIGIATANVFYFTTTETATATPNIRWNDTYSLSSKMAVGDVASVTVITTAAAAAYAANWTIDGTAVTEEWVGGSAPSAGGSDGLDIYSFTIIKTGTGTGDSGWKVIGNLSNAT